MFIQRTLGKIIKEKLLIKGKVIILYGPRQVGKTTLIKKLLQEQAYKTLAINADEQKYVDIFGSRDFSKMKSLVSGYELLFIDEAQRIPEIGLNLKILVDNMPELKIIATGSSSFDLANKISEPLTGRTWSYTLFPISFLELAETNNSFELTSQLEDRLRFGSYPEIFSIDNEKIKREYLESLSSSYLYKDILELAYLKHSSKIRDLLKLLAFQIGNQVSINEIASLLGMGKATVDHYIDLLEKSFVLFRLSAFSRNLRKEVTKMDKIYFYDLGIRNIIIDNVKPMKDRDDVGKLWENFLVMERLKFLRYTQNLASMYFWRTYTGAELDYVEEHGEKLFGYEFKFNPKRISPPKTWLSTYANSHFQSVHKENFQKFITGKS